MVNSEAMLQTMEANTLSSAGRVSGELVISQSSVVHHLHDFDNQARSGRLKIVYSWAMFQATETNTVSSTGSVSGELIISPSSVVSYLQ